MATGLTLLCISFWVISHTGDEYKTYITECVNISALPDTVIRGVLSMSCWQLYCIDLKGLIVSKWVLDQYVQELYNWVIKTDPGPCSTALSLIIFICVSGCAWCVQGGPEFERQSHDGWLLEIYQLSCVFCHCGHNYRSDITGSNPWDF